MNWGKFDCSEFKQWSKSLNEALEQKKVERMMIQALYQIANETLAALREETPVDTGTLRESWQIQKVDRYKGDYVITLYNNQEYASYVENGHRRVVDGVTVDFVNGFYMLRISMQKMAQRIPQIVEQRTQALLLEIFGG